MDAVAKIILHTHIFLHKYVPHTQVGLLWRHYWLLSQMFPEARSCRSLQYPLRSGFFLCLPQKALCVCLNGVSVQKNNLSGWLKFQYELIKNWLLVYLKPWQPWHFIRFCSRHKIIYIAILIFWEMKAQEVFLLNYFVQSILEKKKRKQLDRLWLYFFM